MVSKGTGKHEKATPVTRTTRTAARERDKQHLSTDNKPSNHSGTSRHTIQAKAQNPTYILIPKDT